MIGPHHEALSKRSTLANIIFRLWPALLHYEIIASGFLISALLRPETGTPPYFKGLLAKDEGELAQGASIPQRLMSLKLSKMTNTPEPPKPGQLLNDLQNSAELKHQPIAPSGLDPQLAMLREWQSRRLAGTYADLLADPRSRPACEFFLALIFADDLPAFEKLAGLS